MKAYKRSPEISSILWKIPEIYRHGHHHLCTSITIVTGPSSINPLERIYVIEIMLYIDLNMTNKTSGSVDDSSSMIQNFKFIVWAFDVVPTWKRTLFFAMTVILKKIIFGKQMLRISWNAMSYTFWNINLVTIIVRNNCPCACSSYCCDWSICLQH